MDGALLLVRNPGINCLDREKRRTNCGRVVANTYIYLHIALLKWYNFTEHGYPEGQETPSQFLERISNYFDKWMELAGVDKLY